MDPNMPVESTIRQGQCHICINTCGVLVEVENDRVTAIRGDRDNPVSHGYICVKGRAHASLLSSPERLMRSRVRNAAGVLTETTSSDAIATVAREIERLVKQWGPRSVALYWGTASAGCDGVGPISGAFMSALGSRQLFTTNTIDKGGRHVAMAKHGSWMAPRQAWDEPDVALLLGINPFVSYQGFPIGNPGHWLADQQRRGMRLFVVDPRRSDVAKRADIHLANRPGSDVAILACLIRVILDEHLEDTAFVTQHTQGVAALRAAVERFTPQAVAGLGDVPSDDLVAIARAYATAKRGFVVAGTGPHMSGEGTLVEYLVLGLEAICGRYLRAGETLAAPGVLRAASTAKAQAAPPRPWAGFGDDFHVRGLRETVAGPPTAALPDEILGDHDDRIRALICVGGNPVSGIPDKGKVVRALNALELLVTIDPWMSETSRLADVVIAPTMWLETPTLSMGADIITFMAPGYGMSGPYGCYAPAAVAHPQGSDLVDDWEFFYLLAREMGLPLQLANVLFMEAPPMSLDMTSQPSQDELFELLTTGSRVPLEEVKRHPHGALFPDPPVVVQPADEGWHGRLELADAEMLSDLGRVALTDDANDLHPFRLIARRMQHVHNSTFNVVETNRGRAYNPAFMHPADMTALQLEGGDLVDITSSHGCIRGVVETDAGLRPGTVSMSHCFGDLDLESESVDPFRVGSSTNWLIPNDQNFDRYTGQPRMTNVPVDVRRALLDASPIKWPAPIGN